jgi:Amidase
MSAREIAGSIANGDLSSVEVAEHFVARLQAVNGKLNAVTTDLSGSARKAAADVDKARARGESLPPLAGLPVTIKECFDLAGTASTFGMSSRRNEIESRDDPYVAALRAAGAIPIAKTNIPQLMIYRRPTTRSTGAPTIRGTWKDRAAAVAAAKPRSLRPALPRSASATTSAVRCAFPQPFVASRRAGRPRAVSPIIAPTVCRSARPRSSAKSAPWQDAWKIWSWHCACSTALEIRLRFRGRNWAIRRRRHEPAAICDVYRGRRVSGRAGCTARRRRSIRDPDRGGCESGRLESAAFEPCDRSSFCLRLRCGGCCAATALTGVFAHCF